MIDRLLSQAGLDEEETAVYLAIVELKEATAGKIAQKSGIPRTYTYKILDELMEKGLVQKNEARSIRHFSITDYEAPKRYLQRRQLELLKAEQALSSLSVHLQQISEPEAPSIFSEMLKNEPGWMDFWKLLHSTITREIWLINAPPWWGNPESFEEVEKWEQYRAKQHIWEKRFGTFRFAAKETVRFTEFHDLPSIPESGTLVLIDQYQIQISSFEPFRALRIESQLMVDLIKKSLPQA